MPLEVSQPRHTGRILKEMVIGSNVTLGAGRASDTNWYSVAPSGAIVSEFAPSAALLVPVAEERSALYPIAIGDKTTDKPGVRHLGTGLHEPDQI